jgi:hypothetical protein
MDFDEARIGEKPPRRVEGRIEALGLAHGEHDVRVAGGVDHRVGFLNRARHRLFDQDVDAPCQQVSRQLGVDFGRHRERDRVHAADDVVIVEERLRVVRGRDFFRPRPVGVDHRDELGARQRRQNAGVMLPEVADADDGDTHCHHGEHEDTKARR